MWREAWVASDAQPAKGLNVLEKLSHHGIMWESCNASLKEFVCNLEYFFSTFLCQEMELGSKIAAVMQLPSYIQFWKVDRMCWTVVGLGF